MDSVKYIGMDVHKEAISIAVLNLSGKLVMECSTPAAAVPPRGAQDPRTVGWSVDCRAAVPSD